MIALRSRKLILLDGKKKRSWGRRIAPKDLGADNRAMQFCRGPSALLMRLARHAFGASDRDRAVCDVKRGPTRRSEWQSHLGNDRCGVAVSTGRWGRERFKRKLTSVDYGVGHRAKAYLAGRRCCWTTGEWAADDPVAGVILRSGIVGYKVALVHEFISAPIHRAARSSVLGRKRYSTLRFRSLTPISGLGVK
jgi:hypothetical protein